uniref:Myb/SANT-like domain-containing protein n=1 Tax=Lactuca sativa TaxID=4236 RepID=A0A9R1WPW7_LACSA|nr:hypothetical protein LSAT_V11C100010150 [Lactuca sativa]
MANIKRVRLPTIKVILERQVVREELIHNLLEDGQCRDLIRMTENAFRRLCEILQTEGGLRPTQCMSVEEHVARFLHIVSNNLQTRFTSWMYCRSRSKTSRCFHRVLRSIIAIKGVYIQQPKGDVVPREIQESMRFYPFFKDCIGAIYGTHVCVHVPNKDAPRYSGRNRYPKINVLDVCTFDLKFTYVLTGWEGNASDSRIIKNAFTRDDKLLIPSSRYRLVDAGLPHTSKLMAPYRGNSKELFNLRHASLCNAIERAFGVLKRRFPIIRSTTEPFYSCETQSTIFLACCILHNFLLDEDRDINIEDEVMQEILNGPQEQDRCNSTETDEGNSRAKQLRNSIANEIIMLTNSKNLCGLKMYQSLIFIPMCKVIMSKQEASGSKKEQVKWSDKIDYAYIQAMIKQQEIGNRVNGSFTPTAYAQMVEELNTKHQMDITKSHLKNRYKTLKTHFSQWYDLFRGISLGGFSWNQSTQLIEAEEEVWDNLIQSKLEAASLKTKKVANFDDMLVLFAWDRASGAHAETAKERNARLNKNEKIQLVANNEVHLENEYVDVDDDIQDSLGAKKCKSKKWKFEEEEEEEEDLNSKIMKSVDNVATAIREGNIISDRAYPREYTGEEIYRELELVGLEPHELPKALNFGNKSSKS